MSCAGQGRSQSHGQAGPGRLWQTLDLEVLVALGAGTGMLVEVPGWLAALSLPTILPGL